MHLIQNYSTYPGKICLMSCIRDIFNRHGFEINESVIFAFAEASLFYYKHFDIDIAKKNIHGIELNDLTMGGMRYDIPFMLNNISHHFEAKISLDSSKDLFNTKKFIEEHIDLDQPVLSLLSRKNLSYMSENLRDNVTHSINIIGYDWSSDNLYVSDTYIPTNPVTTYEGVISFNEYYKSIVDSKDIFRNKFEFVSVSFMFQDSLKIDIQDVVSLLKPLKNIARYFLKNESDNIGILTGLTGYKQFLSDYQEWISLDDTKILTKLNRLIHHKLSNYGGPVVTNLLLAEYVDYIISKHNIYNLSKLREILMALNNKWFIIANLFGKYSFNLNNESLKNLNQRLTEVIQLEERAYYMIEKI